MAVAMFAQLFLARFLALAVAEVCDPSGNATCAKCAGSIEVQGAGKFQMTNAYWNVPDEKAGDVEVIGNKVTPQMKGRTYWTDQCNGQYDHNKYANISFLGKQLQFTTDISGAGCGCNAALYLTSLRQSQQLSGCEDFYCDANSVCGLRCVEIDLMEANMYAWHTTMHVADDGSGIGAGYGGGINWNGHRDWVREDYGPSGRCISTAFPFQARMAGHTMRRVTIGFPLDQGRLRAMTVKLTQGRVCDLETEVPTSWYHFQGRDSSAEITEAMAAGMTPIISYWSAPNMLWMDGVGADGLGPCAQDLPELCGESVQFYDFKLESLPDLLV
ncbi:unnamed protein product [Effrenium voratum]|uniref:cellulose 1,4-beta-cellobiosidase (non-reducing end) n=1 Tax=Effrenium voratum TaxID=2562239 RepID=A0AA36MT03_9DINO|nr:unnamed protein product [Effrenium voratum]CAJ1378960.1 unnamed protein product [Effrenium voratum]CAJ1426133.1 unnamed protein product [Effrenium voratum]